MQRFLQYFLVEELTQRVRTWARKEYKCGSVLASEGYRGDCKGSLLWETVFRFMVEGYHFRWIFAVDWGNDCLDHFIST